MITLTGRAVEVIRNLTAQRGLSEDAGLRIAQQGYAGSLGLAMCSCPQAGDEIIETEGARVFLQETAAAMLDGRVLDARLEEDCLVLQIGARSVSS